jgi:hypothetical protein
MREHPLEMLSKEKEVGVLAADLKPHRAIRRRGFHLVGHITRRKDTALFHKAIVHHNVNALEIQRGLRVLDTHSANVLLFRALSSLLDFLPDLASVFATGRCCSIDVYWYLSFLFLGVLKSLRLVVQVVAIDSSISLLVGGFIVALLIIWFLRRLLLIVFRLCIHDLYPVGNLELLHDIDELGHCPIVNICAILYTP